MKKPSSPRSAINVCLSTKTRRPWQEVSAGVTASVMALALGAATASAIPPPDATHWLGQTDGTWTGENWASDAGGTPTAWIPDSDSDLTFSATGAANQNTTLEQDFTIHSLTIDDLTPVAIASGAGGPFTLSIEGNSGVGLQVNEGASLTISANVSLDGTADALVEGGSLTVSGTVSDANNTYVGYSKGDSTLTISGGGSVSNGSGSIGVSASGTNNTVLVTGSGSAWTSTGDLNVGFAGSANTLDIENGGLVSANATKIGGEATAASNALNVTGPGSTLSNADYLIVGYGGVQNSLAILDGGQVENFDAFIGFLSTSTHNEALVSGTGSLWTNTGSFYLGADGGDNRLTVEEGGQVTVTADALVGSGADSSNNLLEVGGTGSGFTTSAALYVGKGGSNNRLEIADGGVVNSVLGRIGGDAGSNGNTVSIDGTGSAWNYSGTIRVGSGGSDNRLEITNGALLSGTGNSFIGYGDAANGNTVVVDGAGSLWQAGAISVGWEGESNRLIVANGGQVTASGIELGSLAGSSGTLQIGDGGAAGIVETPVIAGGFGGGAVEFNHDADGYVFDTIMTGALGVIHSGSGRTIITGANSYTGATEVDAGTLQIGDGITAGATIAGSGVVGVLDGATLAINLANGESFDNDVVNAGVVRTIASGLNFIDGTISGTGNFIQSGTGWTVLNGEIGLDGDTVVADGTLILAESGYVANDVTVIRPGVLAGTGRIGNRLYNGGIVSPGGVNPGTLTVDGDYFQGSHGSLVIRARSTSDYSRLAVGGTALIDGKLVIAANGLTPKRGDSLKILTADDGVAGKFSKVKTNLPDTMLNLEVNYNDTSVVVEFEQQKFTSLSGLTSNQKSVARALDKLPYRGSTEDLFDYLNSLPTSGVPDQLALLSPEQFAAIFNIGFATAQLQHINIERRLDDVRNGSAGFSANGLALTNSRGTYNYDGMPVTNTADGLTLAGYDGKSLVGKETVAPILDVERRWGFFATGSGEWADVENTSQALGSEFTTGGFTLGADYRVSENFVVGITAGYANTGSDLSNGGEITVNGGRGGVYATFFKEGFYLNGAAGGGYNSYDTKRGTVGGIARGNTDGGEFNALLGTGYDWHCGGLTVGPIASLQYTYLGLSSFEESGSDAPLSFNSQSQDSLKSTVGLKFAYAWNCGGVVIRPEVRAQWQHEYLDSTAAVESSFAAGGSAFTVNGPSIGRDSLLLDAGASVQFSPTVSAFAYYTGDIGRSNYSSNSVNGGFRISF